MSTTSTNNHTCACGGLSHPDRLQQQNQDRWFADRFQGLFIVSDGISGTLAGELAATIIVETLPRLLRKRLRDIKTLKAPEAWERLRLALVELSDRLFQETKDQPGLDGMGATVVLVLVWDFQALIGHLGDSRAYLWRKGHLEQLTKDHSFIQLLLDYGKITPDEVTTHQAQGRLTRYVGMIGEALPETQFLELQAGDRLLLCSDGLNRMLPDGDILAILNQKLPLKESCEHLIATANANGGKDNITALILSIYRQQ